MRVKHVEQVDPGDSRHTDLILKKHAMRLLKALKGKDVDGVFILTIGEVRPGMGFIGFQWAGAGPTDDPIESLNLAVQAINLHRKQRFERFLADADVGEEKGTLQ